MPLTPGSRLGAYEILALLGSGGMGQVFRARDTRLDRYVAIKVLPDEMAQDAGAVARFEREAKAVARLSHPNILAIHDFSNDNGTIYAVTELLEGETLREKLAHGEISVDAAIEIALAIAEGLAAAHDRGVIHRDLKPENVFITRDGRVKILDFGLALTHPVAVSSSLVVTEKFNTLPGTMMGTIGYMSPEQIRGEAVGATTDVFAFGCVLYEAVSGKRPFERATPTATLAAVLTQPPQSLPVQVPGRVRRIVDRCLLKEPAERYASARDLLPPLKGLSAGESSKASIERPAPKRLIVLPFRLLRADPDFEFLALSLPDAVTTSLTALDSLIVRSTAIAAKFGSQPDLKAVAEEAGVDWIVTGSVLRAGEQLRVNAQLVEAASGSVLWSGSLSAPVSDIFQIQDDLTGRIVASLKTPLNEREQRNLHHDVPASALGYELFLRANQQGHGTSDWMIARDLYLRALDEDQRFAPAHARLGRIQWLLAKYTGEGEDNWALAEQSLRRALDLNPDHAQAHRIFAELETDLGRAPDALNRLLERLRVRPNDPELYAALIKVLRYCGLLEDSLAADRRGRELDPKIASSIVHTYIHLGRYEEALSFDDRRGDIGYVEPLVLALLGEDARALRSIHDSLSRNSDWRFRAYLESLRAAIEKNPEGVRIAAQKLRAIRDPEALFYTGRALIHAGELAEGLDFLETAIPGFSSVPMIESDPWLEPVRTDDRFLRLLDAAKARRKSAAERVRHSSFV